MKDSLKAALVVGGCAYMTGCWIRAAHLQKQTFEMHRSLDEAVQIINRQKQQLEEALAEQMPSDMIVSRVIQEFQFFEIAYQPPTGYKFYKKLMEGKQ